MPSRLDQLAARGARRLHSFTAERKEDGQLAECTIEPLGRDAIKGSYSFAEAPTRRPVVTRDGTVVEIEVATIHLLRSEKVKRLLPLGEETLVTLAAPEGEEEGDRWVVDPDRDLVDGPVTVVVPLKRNTALSETGIDPLAG